MTSTMTHQVQTTTANLISDRSVDWAVPTTFRAPVVHLRVGPGSGHYRYQMTRLGDALVRWLDRHGFEGWDVARIVRTQSLPAGHAEITLIERVGEGRR